MESQTEDAEASSGLSQDTALFAGSHIPAISVIISKREDEGKKVESSASLKMNVPHSSRETLTSEFQ